MNNSAESTKDSIINTLEVYTSKWKTFLVCVFISIVLASIYLRYATNKYEATASIKLKDDSSKKLLPEITRLQNYGMFAGNDMKVEDEIEVIKSRSILEQVVKNLQLNIKYSQLGTMKEQEIYKNPPVKFNFITSDSILHKLDTTLYFRILSESEFVLSNESNSTFLTYHDIDGEKYSFGDNIKTPIGDLILTPNTETFNNKIGDNFKIDINPVLSVVEKYKESIKIIKGSESNVIVFKLQENIKVKAEEILDNLINTYNEDAIADKELIVRTTSDFINNRLELVAAELEQVDKSAEMVQKSNRLSNLSSQSAIFLQSEKETEQKLANTANEIQIIDYMTDYIESNNTEADVLPSNLGISDNNISQITKNHNDLVLQRNRILKNSSEKNPTVVNLNNQIRAMKENIAQSLENLKQSQEITLRTLNEQDRRISSQIYMTPQKERQFRDVKRQQDIKESLYLYLLQKREETAITLGMASPKAKIIESAYTSYIPVFPKRSIIYIVSLLLGLIIPFIYIYLKDLLDSKIHSKQDLMKITDAPIIGDIPKYGTLKGKSVVSVVDYSPKAEAFRLLRTNIDFMMRGKWRQKGKIIFITSTVAQEGKSHTSVNLATTIAHSNKKVLLIETDIRVPSSSKYLKVKNKRYGLTEFIVDKSLKIKDVIYPVEGKNDFYILPSGAVPPNPAELLMSDRIPELFEKVKNDYDYVIVDTAAVGLVTDTLIIGEHADIFVYVVSANNLDKRQLNVANTMFEEARLPNMVLLLNGTMKIAGYGYGYGYGKDPESNSRKWYDRIPFIKVNA